MPADLTNTLVVGISSRALFDLEEANEVFENEGQEAYARYQLERQRHILDPGTGFPVVQAILDLNKKAGGERVAEVVIMSQNNPATSIRLFHSIEHYRLDISRAVLSGGSPLAPYMKTFAVDLYLSAFEGDVQDALKTGTAAAVIYGTRKEEANPSEELRIAFDGDCVLFSDEAERIYQEHGLEKFLDHERQNARKPLPDGPFAKLLRTLSKLQDDERFEKPPIRTALITARNLPAHMRVLNTLITWGVDVDEAFFLGGLPKTEILGAFRPHIFFDDQEVHCIPASKVVSTGRVPARTPPCPATTPNKPKGRPRRSKRSG